MTITTHYPSPLGDILLACDEMGLTGLWFEGQEYYARTLPSDSGAGESPVLEETRRWLDIYFSGEEPDFTPPLNPSGTPFQKAIWARLLKIPYGETRTYSDLGPPRAVGNAVGHNPISLIIPCHRVVGRDGKLTGYAGGLERKRKLLKLENAEFRM